jgi:hypothetical protein
MLTACRSDAQQHEVAVMSRSKTSVPPISTGSPWVRELYDNSAPVRREAIDRGYPEAEINEAIDQALHEIRTAESGSLNELGDDR